MVDQITACIKTFERPEACHKAIAALRQYYPGLKIIVADDSQEASDFGDVEHIRLPYDTGLAAGRNALVEACATPYALVMDDDMIINETVDLGVMLEALGNTSALVVGVEKKSGRFRNTGSMMRLYDGTLTFDRATNTGTCRGHRFVSCDFLPNFLLAGVDLFKRVRWDEQFKCGGEHNDFFLRLILASDMKMPCALFYDMYFTDLASRPAGYDRKRADAGRDDATLFRRKWGIKNVVRWNDGITGKMDYETGIAS